MPKETARAKINLNLHVGRLVEDPGHKYFGYHPLLSLVVFADYGDTLSCHEAEETSLAITGPFSDGLEMDKNNLILKAYEATTSVKKLPALAFHLVKNLPLASGIGGGSADAAAALRLMRHYVDMPESDWLDIALSLGADVPVCFHSRTCVMRGIGENIKFQPDFERLNAVLVNPNKKVSTGAIFRLFDESPDDANQAASRALQNDLQAPAINLLGDIQLCLDALGSHDGNIIHGMSGSGATCFGLFESAKDAENAARKLKQNYSHWWVQPVMLGDQP